jgi:pimeloyl-ACP methyl ester carboxylesterase
MQSRTVGEPGAPTLLFVMGFGNRLDGASVEWFLDRLVGAGFRVHAVELPTDVADFDAEYRRPVQRVHDERDPTVVVGHSLGGLVTAYLETAARTVYLAPWWGMQPGKVSPWERWLVPRLPTRARVLPIRTRRDEIGEHLSDDEWERLPKRVSPAFATAVYRAQQTRPPVGDDAVVFVSLADTVVGLDAIGVAVPADRIRLYDGGHQLFAARGRDEAVEGVVRCCRGAGSDRGGR